ncbi:MAG: (d)CMP kinase [Candidatus Latescibacterota bacterium]
MGSEGASVLTVSGLPGSGTTTACRLLGKALGWPHVNAGQIFRELAAGSGLTLAELGRRAEEDGEIDRQLDARMVATARRLGRVVLEGRLTGWMASRHGLPALRTWLAAPLEVRARRVSRRDGQPLAQATRAMQEREASEARRYRLFHQIEIADLSVYDLVVDTGSLPAARVAQQVLRRLGVEAKEVRE